MGIGNASDQGWFWTSQWQAGERQASAQIAAGDTTFHASTAEFLASLDAPAPETGQGCRCGEYEETFASRDLAPVACPIHRGRTA